MPCHHPLAGRNEEVAGFKSRQLHKTPWSGRFRRVRKKRCLRRSCMRRATGAPQDSRLEAPRRLRGAFSLGLASINSEIASSRSRGSHRRKGQHRRLTTSPTRTSLSILDVGHQSGISLTGESARLTPVSRGLFHSRSTRHSDQPKTPGQRLLTAPFATKRPRVQIPPAPQVHPVLVGETPDQHSAEPESRVRLSSHTPQAHHRISGCQHLFRRRGGHGFKSRQLHKLPSLVLVRSSARYQEIRRITSVIRQARHPPVLSQPLSDWVTS